MNQRQIGYWESHFVQFSWLSTAWYFATIIALIAVLVTLTPPVRTSVGFTIMAAPVQPTTAVTLHGAAVDKPAL